MQSLCLPLLQSEACLTYSIYVVSPHNTYTWKHTQTYMTRFNERTNTLLYKNIPFTLYFQKGCERVDVGYVWEVSWRRRETATYWPQVPLTIAAPLPYSAGLLNIGSPGPKPSVWSWFSFRHLISNWNCSSNSNWLKPSVAPGLFDIHLRPVGVRICSEFNHVHRSRWYSDIFDRMHLFPLFICLFTQVHLLIDDSVEAKF